MAVLSARALPLRLVRSATAAAVSVALAVAGHLFGGGAVASGTLLAVAFVAIFAATLRLSSRQLTTGQIVGLLLLGQAAVHVGCAFGSTAATFGATMLVGHAIATALTAAALVYGERCLWAMADSFGLRTLGMLRLRAVATPLAKRSPIVREVGFCPIATGLVGRQGLRGPPVGCA